jgi:prepilin-type N-terminal cleavage/methylation domain-containing protein
MKSCRGFTLIERMNVVSVIGIIMSIAITNYKQYVTRSKIAGSNSMSDFTDCVKRSVKNTPNVSAGWNDAGSTRARLLVTRRCPRFPSTTTASPAVLPDRAIPSVTSRPSLPAKAGRLP